MAVSYASLLSMNSISFPRSFSQTRTSIDACSLPCPRLQKSLFVSDSPSSFLSGAFRLLPLHFVRPIWSKADSWSFSVRSMADGDNPTVTDKVCLEVCITGEPYEKPIKGKIVIGLYGEAVPRTAERFLSLCKESSYRGSKFNKIRDFMIQGGHVDRPTHMSVGMSPPKRTLSRTRSFTEDVIFHFIPGPGDVCMVDPGSTISGTEFFICTKKAPWLAQKHVVFGKVLGSKSMDMVYKIASLDTDESLEPSSPGGKRGGFPKNKVEITNCKQIY